MIDVRKEQSTYIMDDSVPYVLKYDTIGVPIDGATPNSAGVDVNTIDISINDTGSMERLSTSLDTLMSSTTKKNYVGINEASTDINLLVKKSIAFSGSNAFSVLSNSTPIATNFA